MDQRSAAGPRGHAAPSAGWQSEDWCQNGGNFEGTRIVIGTRNRMQQGSLERRPCVERLSRIPVELKKAPT